MPSQEHRQTSQVQQGSDATHDTANVGYSPAGGLSAYASMVGIGDTPEAGGDQASFAAAHARLATNAEAGLYYEDLVRDAKGETRALLLDIFFPRYADFNAMAKACDAAATAERTEMEKHDGEHAQRIELLSKVRAGITEGKALVRGMSDLTDAECWRIRDAAMDDSRLGAVEDWVAGVFQDQSEALATKLYGMELERTKSEEAASRLYTRLQPSSLTQDDVQAAREAYMLTLSIPLGDGAVTATAQTPYHISSRLGTRPSPAVNYSESGKNEGNADDVAGHAVAYAKGDGDQTQAVVQGLIDSNQGGILDTLTQMWREGQENGLTEAEFASRAGPVVESFLAKNFVGVDCSGFAMRVTLQDPDIAAGWSERHPGATEGFIITNNANVSAMRGRTERGDKNTELVPVSATRTGDLVTNSGGHVGVVEVSPTQVKWKDVVATEGIHVESSAGLKPEDLVWKVGIAHSVDSSNRSIPSNLPGPHLATYYFHDNGRRLAREELQGANSTFVEFRRPMVYPASSDGSNS